MKTWKFIMPLGIYQIDTGYTNLRDAKSFVRNIYLKVRRLPNNIQWLKT